MKRTRQKMVVAISEPDVYNATVIWATEGAREDIGSLTVVDVVHDSELDRASGLWIWSGKIPEEGFWKGKWRRPTPTEWKAIQAHRSPFE